MLEYKQVQENSADIMKQYNETLKNQALTAIFEQKNYHVDYTYIRPQFLINNENIDK